MTHAYRPHDREELGAYVLGLLTPEQAHAVEEHLASCRECRHEWEELREMTDLLDEVPPEVFLDGPPDGDLVLQRTLRQIRSEVGSQRRRKRLSLVAASVVGMAVVLGGGVALGRTTAGPPTVIAAPAPAEVPTDAQVLTGTGPDGVVMTAMLTPATGWVRVSATVQGIPAGERCRLVVVARDGSRQVAGSWLVPPTGWKEGVTLHGSAIIAPDQVASVMVENEAGRQFAHLQTA
ncbi:anti-sigma factor family protein [Pseudonocardia xinjiangensis]|jgi:anti-sigma factor RsiW|uniref:Anti-sigma factor n=1 Tax=Pseudonocardia xinjiangensis TaxID=75289 RepID=A0ABX1RJI9_9PSEU|nr:zf-HC2 domain-containing protein [Pseudonocardia xinjiangensis]NMH80566.1 anti-sigma factor [Pseudonocardia xinjiangensis]